MSGPVPSKAFDKALKPLYDWIKGSGPENGSLPVVTGLTVTHDGAGAYRKTVLHFKDVAFAMTDVASTVAYSGKKIYDLPDGAILFLGAHANLALTKSSAGINDDWDGDFGLGTVTASNNATLSSTEQDLIPTTATPQAAGGATTAKGVSTGTEALKILDGTGTAKDVYLNFLVDDGDQDVTTTPANLIVNGTVELFWINLGDV
jgi:hypothetical protein